MKKVAIIGSVGIPANYGGFETLTEKIVEQLSDKYDITVYCSRPSFRRQDRKKFHKGARLKYIPLKANGVSSIFYDYISILRALFVADTLLILGVSGCTLLPFVRWLTNKKVIVNIDGLEWKRKKWKGVARWFLRLSEALAIRYSHADIADNRAIQRYTAMYYGSMSHLIAYGGPLDYDRSEHPEIEEKYPFMSEKYFIKVARIEPENNVELILQAFSELDIPLVLIGNWKSSEYAQNLRKRFEGYSNIHLLDPIYTELEINYLRRKAYAYVHGHEAGGTNPSLVEAMCLRLPVITYDVSFNRETTKDEAIYFRHKDDLKLIVKYASEDVLKLNASCMRFNAAKYYNWEVIARQYHCLIQSLYETESEKKVLQRLPNELRIELRSGNFESVMSEYRFEFQEAS